MFFIRTAIVGGVVIALLPSDPDKQQALIDTARDKMHWAMTYCDREPAQCEQASELWAGFVKKAEFGARMAGELATHYTAGGTAAETQAAEAPLPAKGQARKRLKTAIIEPIRVRTAATEEAPGSHKGWDQFQPE